jgi:mono/diheme cytochrome c family protein
MTIWLENGRAVAGSIVAAAIFVSSVPTAASSVAQGKRLALLYCAECHAIDKVSPSPLRIAPPFRTLHERYPVETLQEALAEGIVTGHPSMPEFRFEADQVGDFMAFLKSLEQ